MNNQKCQDDEIDLRNYIQVILKRKKIILTVFSICVIFVTVISFLIPPTYQAVAIVRMGSINQFFFPKEEAIIKLQEGPLLNSIIQELDLNIDIFKLKEMMTIENIPKTEFLKLKIQSANPNLAVNICNTIANTFILEGKELYDKKLILIDEQIKMSEKKRENIENGMEKLNQLIMSQVTNPDFPLIQSTLSNYESMYITVDERIFSLKKELLDCQQFEIFQPAIISKYPIKPNKKLNIVISAVVGLMLGILIGFFQEFLEKDR